MVCPFCPLGTHKSRKREMWVLRTLLVRPNYSHLALGGRVLHWEGRKWSQKISQKLGKPMVCPFCPLGPQKSWKREVWVLWTFSGRPIYSHLGLGGRVMYWEGREWSQKISKKLGKPTVCPFCPLGPHRSRIWEMWVLWTFSGWPIYSHLAIGGRVM